MIRSYISSALYGHVAFLWVGIHTEFPWWWWLAVIAGASADVYLNRKIDKANAELKEARSELADSLNRIANRGGS